MMPELKPCPFCNSKNINDYFDDDEDYIATSLACKDCGAVASKARWNTRPDGGDSLREALECLRRLEVIGPYNGVAWLHLRPEQDPAGKSGLISIRIEGEMAEQYVEWFKNLNKARLALAAKDGE